MASSFRRNAVFVSAKWRLRFGEMATRSRFGGNFFTILDNFLLKMTLFPYQRFVNLFLNILMTMNKCYHLFKVMIFLRVIVWEHTQKKTAQSPVGVTALSFS